VLRDARMYASARSATAELVERYGVDAAEEDAIDTGSGSCFEQPCGELAVVPGASAIVTPRATRTHSPGDTGSPLSFADWAVSFLCGRYRGRADRPRPDRPLPLRPVY
jgi:hypothetical protein